ncbi:MAG: hypothetical protein KDE04_20135, partial [Anaerolineales bacterium]|nr:hypothetical protein [Anaerolineales bacterium]
MRHDDLVANVGGQPEWGAVGTVQEASDTFKGVRVIAKADYFPLDAAIYSRKITLPAPLVAVSVCHRTFGITPEVQFGAGRLHNVTRPAVQQRGPVNRLIEAFISQQLGDD